MHVFHIRYRNTQGTLMRILTAVSRRGIELPYVQAEPAEQTHQATLLLEVNPKQIGQLCRDWRAIVDVMEVRPGAATKETFDPGGTWTTRHHPPASATSAEAARQASA